MNVDGWFLIGGLIVLSIIIVVVKLKINCKLNVWLYFDYF